MHQKRIILKEILISYYTNDLNDDAVSLIFLHGWGSDSIYWFKTFTQDFLDTYNIFCIDLPGFAKSANPTRDLNVSGYGDYIVEFIQKLNLKNVVIIGHSLGGRISIKLAVEHPELLTKVVLVDSAGIYHTTKSTKLVTKISHIFKPLFKPQFMQGLRGVIYKFLKSEDYLTNPHLQKTFINVVQEDLEPYLSKINLPTLIVWGELDENEYTPLDDGIKMNEAIKNSDLVILQGAKHYSFLDQPERFINSLVNFIENK